MFVLRKNEVNNVIKCGGMCCNGVYINKQGPSFGGARVGRFEIFIREMHCQTMLDADAVQNNFVTFLTFLIYNSCVYQF